MYFFNDQTNIFILLIRHYGMFDFLDFITESSKVGQILELDFVCRNGLDEPTDKSVDGTGLKNDYFL